jgi:hypothetical protein
VPAKPDECLEYLGKAALGVNLHAEDAFAWCTFAVGAIDNEPGAVENWWLHFLHRVAEYPSNVLTALADLREPARIEFGHDYR